MFPESEAGAGLEGGGEALVGAGLGGEVDVGADGAGECWSAGAFVDVVAVERFSSGLAIAAIAEGVSSVGARIAAAVVALVAEG